MNGWPVALIGLLAVCVATASRAALPETGCPGSWTGSGIATWYDAFDQPNACGLPLSPDQYVVAVAEAAYDGSAVCGRCLHVTGPLGSIVARITDYCVGPSCHELDLSPNAFAAIGEPDDGEIPVVWESVACDVEGPVAFAVDPGSNAFYAKFQVRNHRTGVASVAAAQPGDPFTTLARSVDNAFEFAPDEEITTPLSLRVTDVHGALLAESLATIAPGALVAGTGQLPACPEPGPTLGGAISVVALMALRARRAAT